MIVIPTGPMIVDGYGGMRVATQCSDGGEAGWVYMDGNGPHGSIDNDAGGWANFNQSISTSSSSDILAFPGEECVYDIFIMDIFL